MKGYKIMMLAAAMVAAAGCTKHEEIEFAGVVVETQTCTAAFPQLSYGYLVSLEYPEGMGTDVELTEGDTARNVMVMYDPPLVIRKSDHIHGTFYRDDKYSKVNCSWQWDGVELHEGVLLETEIDGRR